MTTATATAKSGRAVAERVLFLHIGLPKTGSTTIQHALAGLAPALERRGVHVIEAGRNNAGSHEGLKDGFVKPSLASGRRALALAAREVGSSPARGFVVSCERLTAPVRGHGEWPGRVRAWAQQAGVSIHPVAYVRPQWEMVEATYADLSERGWTTARFDEFRSEQAFNLPLRLDYGRRLQPWREAFGTALAVYPLERAAADAGLVGHFLRVLGVDDARLLGVAADLPERNRRRGGKYVEVRRRATSLAGRRPPVRGRALGDAAGLIRGDRPFAGLTTDDIAELTVRFETANASFAREFGVDIEGVLFRTPPPTGRRAHAPAWSEFGRFERRLLRHYVFECIGTDIDPGAGGDQRGGSLVRAAVRWRLGLHWLRSRAVARRAEARYARAAQL